ncbi:hypothetical protein ES703_124335 [subsurface metagenome]
MTFIASDGELTDSETITITVTSSGSGSITDGLVGYWKLNDNAANTTVANSSGYGNDGTAQRNTSAMHVAGKINGALNFNGISDYIDCGNDNSLDITGSVSISAWVRFDSLPDYQTILVKRGAVADTGSNYALRTGTTTNRDEVEFYYHDGTNWHVYTTSNANLIAGQWYHTVVTFTFGTTISIRCYLNNNLLSGSWTLGNGNSPVQINTKPVTIGGLTSEERADGVIDNVMIFSRILSQQEIDTLYNGGAGIEITLNPSNSAPVLSPIGDKSVNENEPLSFTVNASDADGDPITYSAQNLPAGATFTGNSFSWTPGYDQAGSYQATFIASDGQLEDQETIIITVKINVSFSLTVLFPSGVRTGALLTLFTVMIVMFLLLISSTYGSKTWKSIKPFSSSLSQTFFICVAYSFRPFSSNLVMSLSIFSTLKNLLRNIS